jgi:flagellar hook-basal body complex protein FliE
MIVAPVSGLAGALGGGLTPQAAESLTHGSAAAPALPGAPAEGLAAEGITGSEQAQGLAQAGQVEGLSQPAQVGGGAEPGGTSSGGFGGALTEAISSLEGTQQSAAGAAQALATGTVKDPESAVVTVENAQMAMDLASQLRTKAAEAAQSIFQTQV